MSNQATAMSVAGVMPFDCPNCGAPYKLVRVETDEALPDEQRPQPSGSTYRIHF